MCPTDYSNIYIAANAPIIVQIVVISAIEYRRGYAPSAISALAYTIICSAPIVLTCLFKTMSASTGGNLGLNLQRGVGAAMTMSVLAVILLAFEKLTIIFPLQADKVCHSWRSAGLTVLLIFTIVSQVINVWLMEFDAKLGVFRFHTIFFLLHCIEFFFTLLLVESLFLWGLCRHRASFKRDRLPLLRVYLLMACTVMGNLFTHIVMPYYNTTEGIDIGIPIIVKLTTSGNVLLVVALLVMRLTAHTTNHTSAFTGQFDMPKIVPGVQKKKESQIEVHQLPHSEAEEQLLLKHPVCDVVIPDSSVPPLAS